MFKLPTVDGEETSPVTKITKSGEVAPLYLVVQLRRFYEGSERLQQKNGEQKTKISRQISIKTKLKLLTLNNWRVPADSCLGSDQFLKKTWAKNPLKPRGRLFFPGRQGGTKGTKLEASVRHIRDGTWQKEKPWSSARFSPLS